MTDFIYNNNPYKIYFKGNISCEEINLINSFKNKDISKEGYEFIEKNWQEIVKKSNDVYDGDLVELIDFKDKNLYFDYTKYSYTLTTKKPEWKTINKGNYKSNHIACSIIIKTNNNKFLIVSDLKFRDNIQNWKFIGGFMEKEDKTIFDCVKREAEEETGLSKYITNYNILSVYGTGHSCCVFGISEVGLTSNEAIDYIQKNKESIKDNYETAVIKAINFDSKKIQNLLDCPLLNFGSMTSFNLYLLNDFILGNL
ncbi:MAG TPA: NUDIX hydrolase [Rickettsiales bacterium]|nr:NUDIX hydrolase [Rickettsiales bacterium]